MEDGRVIYSSADTIEIVNDVVYIDGSMVTGLKSINIENYPTSYWSKERLDANNN